MLKGCNLIASLALIQQLYYQYFTLLPNYRAIFDTSSERSEAHVLSTEGALHQKLIYTCIQILAHCAYLSLLLLLSGVADDF